MEMDELEEGEKLDKKPKVTNVMRGVDKENECAR